MFHVAHPSKKQSVAAEGSAASRASSDLHAALRSTTSYEQGVQMMRPTAPRAVGGSGAVVQRKANAVQRVVTRGQDPVAEFAQNPGDKSLLYGLHPYRLRTQGRMTHAGVDTDLAHGRPNRTIDEYNGAVGINGLMTVNQSAVGLFMVREALADPGNWAQHLPGANAAAMADADVQAWVQQLAGDAHRIGLHDFGNRTKEGMFLFRKRAGAKKINSKDRLEKNLTDAHSGNISANEINHFLRPGTYQRAMTEFQSLPNAKQQALNHWIYKAFFRRTSKLGIDFAVNTLNAKVHFNTTSAVDHRSPNQELNTPRNRGLALHDQMMDQSHGRSITVSELRHVRKGIANNTLDRRRINQYDER